MTTNDHSQPSFEGDIRPLFRDSDRTAMLRAFDLWSYADVRDHGTAILARLREGTMPCDEAWPSTRVDLFAHWLEDGAPQ
jgi:hypothetical protein